MDVNTLITRFSEKLYLTLQDSVLFEMVPRVSEFSKFSNRYFRVIWFLKILVRKSKLLKNCKSWNTTPRIRTGLDYTIICKTYLRVQFASSVLVSQSFSRGIWRLLHIFHIHQNFTRIMVFKQFWCIWDKS